MKKPLKKSFGLVLFALLFMVFACNNADQSADLKLAIDKYLEFWNTTNFNGIEDVLCEDFELIMSPKFEPETGIEHFKQEIMNLHIAYPDFKIVINEMILDDEKVAGIWTITGTNTGHGSRPPTGKSIKVEGISIIHFKDGKIKDEWIAGNEFQWLQQLGYTFTPPVIEK